MNSRAHRWLVRFGFLTLVLLLLVVLAGAVVRATGSGMGCPDWPRCYGRLIPPTSADQIVFDRLDLEKYQKAWQRNGRENITVTRESIAANFNARETWTEFINRCFGALAGLAALATLACAMTVRPFPARLVVLLGAQLLLFGVVAWLGKVVVDTNLLPWKITVHMGLAVVLVTTALIAAHWISPRSPVPHSPRTRWLLALCLVLTACQIVMGTQVRETVDHLQAGECCDGRLEERLGGILLWHRIGAIAVTVAVCAAFVSLRRSGALRVAPVLCYALAGIIVAEYLAGVVLIRFHLPAVLQPVHLVLAVLLHVVLLSLLLRSRLRPSPATSTLPADV